MFELNKIYNESCLDTMKSMTMNNQKVDIILTSPPYYGVTKTCSGHNTRSVYSEFDFTKIDYCKLILDCFKQFENILNTNGVCLLNIGYGNEKLEYSMTFWNLLCDIINNTEFCIADKIVWKKSNSIPFSIGNKLSRICEDVYIFAKKKDFKTFKINKLPSKNGINLKNIHNIVYGRNNDNNGTDPITKLNTATFSSEFVINLLNIYSSSKNDIVYDPFMGSGTTGFACKKLGLRFIGSEICKEQCEFAENRLEKVKDILEW